MPSNENAVGSLVELAKVANRPNRYSVLSSRPVKVRVTSTRPWTSSAKRGDLMAFA